jgi:uncharacterized protein (DUF4213/DUF364 family)
MIVDDLIGYALERADHRKIADVRAGLSYCCVMLEDKACGLAYTFRNEMGQCCCILDESGSLIGRDCAEIIPWAKDSDRLKAAIGLSAVNAVLNTDHAGRETGDVAAVLGIEPDDTFGMIGDFAPILAKIRRQTSNIYVFEKNPDRGEGLYTDAQIPEFLPKCDVIIITATSLINHTLDDILRHCENARQVCIVGPSTPLCAQVFKGYPVTILAGSVVRDPDRLLQIVSQGGGTRAMKQAVVQALERIEKRA